MNAGGTDSRPGCRGPLRFTAALCRAPPWAELHRVRVSHGDEAEGRPGGAGSAWPAPAKGSVVGAAAAPSPVCRFLNIPSSPSPAPLSSACTLLLPVLSQNDYCRVYVCLTCSNDVVLFLLFSAELGVLKPVLVAVRLPHQFSSYHLMPVCEFLPFVPTQTTQCHRSQCLDTVVVSDQLR